MAITAALVKELREKTSAGMMECKKALVKTDGDLEKAIDILKESGLAKAEKKSGRVAAEGRVAVAKSGSKATIVEVNCETDFVSKGDEFGDFAQSIADAALQANTANVEEISKLPINGGSVDEVRAGLISKLGENMTVRRAEILNQDGLVTSGYIHGAGKIGVIIAAKCNDEAKTKTEELLRNLAMHISAMSPSVISYKDLDPKFVEKETIAIKATIEKGNVELFRLGKQEKRIPEFASMLQLTDEALKNAEDAMKKELEAQGKPEKIWDKIIPGQMARFIVDNTQIDQDLALLSQAYVMDDKKTVEQAISDTDASIELVKFVRFELGDGIEKKEDNFVEEVMAQAKGG